MYSGKEFKDVENQKPPAIARKGFLDGYFCRMTNSMPRTGEHNDNSNLLRGIRLPAFLISFYVSEEPFLRLIEKDNLLNVRLETTGT